MNRKPKKKQLGIPDAQSIPADTLDHTLMTMFLYADISMTLIAPSANRMYSVDAVVAAAKQLPDDSVARKLAEPHTVKLILRALMQNGLVAASGDRVKLSIAGVRLAKTMFMPPERRKLIEALR